jgi:Tfp pilus assembly protein PilF
LATPQEDGALVLHRLVATFIRGVNHTDVNETARTAVEHAVATEAERTNEHGDPRWLLSWQPHLRAVADTAGCDDRPAATWLLNELGRHLSMVADFAGARAAFERALAIHEGAHGPDHPLVATAINNLGAVLQAQGDLPGARPAYERALAIHKCTYGPDHPDVAIRINNLGIVLQDQGDLAGARAAFERALAILHSRLGEQQPHTSIVRQALAAMASKTDLVLVQP